MQRHMPAGAVKPTKLFVVHKAVRDHKACLYGNKVWCQIDHNPCDKHLNNFAITSRNKNIEQSVKIKFSKIACIIQLNGPTYLLTIHFRKNKTCEITICEFEMSILVYFCLHSVSKQRSKSNKSF